MLPTTSTVTTLEGVLTIDACMACTLYIDHDEVTADRPDIPQAVAGRFPDHTVWVADEDPKPFSSLPCGCCYTARPGARQKIFYRRRSSPPTA